MWVLKTKTSSENTIFPNIAKKFHVNFSGYPIRYIKNDNNLILQVCGFVEGTKMEINNFISQIKKETIFKNIYSNEEFVIAYINIPFFLEALYSPEIIFIKPMKYTSSGFEYMEIVSWDKEPLIKIVNILKENYNLEILSFSKKNIKNISIMSYSPELTDKQKIALELAIKNGYYNFPKKITMKKLAKLMNVSFSTYQAHLSKAESKFLPKMYEKNFIAVYTV